MTVFRAEPSEPASETHDKAVLAPSSVSETAVPPVNHRGDDRMSAT